MTHHEQMLEEHLGQTAYDAVKRPADISWTYLDVQAKRQWIKIAQEVLLENARLAALYPHDSN